MASYTAVVIEWAEAAVRAPRKIIGAALAVGAALVTAALPARAVDLGPIERISAHDVLAVSSDGRYAVVDYRSVPSTGTNAVWVDTVTGQRVPLGFTASYFVELSGDGLHVLSHDGLRYTWQDISSGDVRGPAPGLVGQSPQPTAHGQRNRLMTDDGSLSVVETEYGSVLYDARTGTAEQVETVPFSYVTSMSADGRYLLLTEWNCPLFRACYRSVLLDRGTGARTDLGSFQFNDGKVGRMAIAISADGRYVFEIRGEFDFNTLAKPSAEVVRLDRLSGHVDVIGTWQSLGPDADLQVSDDGRTLVAHVGTEYVAVDAATGRLRTTGWQYDSTSASARAVLAGGGDAMLGIRSRPQTGVPFPLDIGELVRVPIYRQLAADTPLALTVAGLAGVPADAAAVALNVTAVDPTAPGFVTVWPCGAATPETSNLNYAAGQTVPNAVITRVGDGGQVCLQSHAPVDLVVDVQGYFPAGSPVVTQTPERLLDTRAAIGVDGTTPVGAGSAIRVQIAGRGGVPADARTVSLNLTVTEPSASGFVTLFPCTAEAPLASNLNYGAGQTRANAAIVSLDASGGLCLLTKSTAHLVVDVNGYVGGGGSSVVGLDPTRVLDTREARAGRAAGPVAAGTTVVVPVGAVPGLPANPAAVIVNVTVTGPANAGYATAFPCDGPAPLASNLNFVGGETVANLAVVRPDASGNVCVLTSALADVVVDVTGAIVGGGSYAGAAPTRILDTRFA